MTSTLEHPSQTYARDVPTRLADRQTLWQGAWAVMAGVSGLFCGGLLLARITSQPSLAWVALSGVLLVVSLYCVFAPVFHGPPFREPKERPTAAIFTPPVIPQERPQKSETRGGH